MNINVVALNEILRHEGRSKTWLARQLGMSRDHLYHILGGDRPSPANLPDRIAEALGIDARRIAVSRANGTSPRRRAS